jgi:hypothetical protein
MVAIAPFGPLAKSDVQLVLFVGGALGRFELDCSLRFVVFVTEALDWRSAKWLPQMVTEAWQCSAKNDQMGARTVRADRRSVRKTWSA